MRFVRCIEDDNGDLVELVYYCGAICFEAEVDPGLRAAPGGAWPCLGSTLSSVGRCQVCGEAIGDVKLHRGGATAASVAHARSCDLPPAASLRR